MTAFVTWGYNFASTVPPPAAEAKQTEPETTPAKRVPIRFHIPGWISLTVKYTLAFGVLGLCITGVVFVTDFFEVKKGHEGFIPRPDQLIHGIGFGHPTHGLPVYDSGNNGHHGIVKPEEWCGKHPGDCRWANSQVCI
ncbi:hypothetical protein CTA2_8289 [Colletotrichum tanaceti]|uniref:Uncharacterized protein n=1 Tax=Colletotrichum tanaceti TaxID=1306861 RepID=A0A4U6XMR3_9PEZI|nr:hypothetical protein CTA2_8289 [Colletotrichum tanaceti]TKW56989.1 hypothetical protein CTA1_13037 [Colletotrichum tanaceti]